jgi:hypothetical protein
MRFEVFTGVYLIVIWYQLIMMLRVIDASLEAFTAMFPFEVFWVVTPRNFAVGYQRFGGPCCLHFQERWYPTATLHDVTTQKTSTWKLQMSATE